jgi:hypothetical protein
VLVCKLLKRMAPQVGLESPRKRNFNNLQRSRWHVIPRFRSKAVRTARKWHGLRGELLGPKQGKNGHPSINRAAHIIRLASYLSQFFLRQHVCRVVGVEQDRWQVLLRRTIAIYSI